MPTETSKRNNRRAKRGAYERTPDFMLVTHPLNTLHGPRLTRLTWLTWLTGARVERGVDEAERGEEQHGAAPSNHKLPCANCRVRLQAHAEVATRRQWHRGGCLGKQSMRAVPSRANVLP